MNEAGLRKVTHEMNTKVYKVQVTKIIMHILIILTFSL
jgi:hypothetical protein